MRVQDSDAKVCTVRTVVRRGRSPSTLGNCYILFMLAGKKLHRIRLKTSKKERRQVNELI